ncbi:unnamed protein product [Clonostachys solani]|uniref:Uncharacterized protein n=1 Tax=Clonostachys solani TaxID=160281 RepID=A0A9N9YZQ6_9HYPO|nr:unnamed protein product [Clonostachys solani]
MSTDVLKHCFFVRSPDFLYESGVSNYQVEDGDFQRFVDGLKKPPGEDDATNAIMMKQVCYAQLADRAERLSPVRGTISTTYYWTSRQDDIPDDLSDTLYLHECGKPSIFDMEFSRNGQPFIGYLQKHRDDYTCIDSQTWVGAVTMNGRLLLREGTPMWVDFNCVDVNMASNKQEFERGIHIVNRLRMEAADFWESVAASVGDPSTYEAAPDDWIPLQDRLFGFPESWSFARSFRASSRRGTELSIEPRIGDEEFQTFRNSRWTAGSDSLRIFAKYALDHQSPPPFTANIPLTQLGLDPADPRYEPFNGYVPSNFFIMVREEGCRRHRKAEKLCARATDFAEKVTQLVERKFPHDVNLVAFVVEVTNHEMNIWLGSLVDSGPSPESYCCSPIYFYLRRSKEEFDRGLRALALVRKTAADIQRRLCADVAARRTREVHVPAQPDLMEASRSEDEEIRKVNDTMARIDLGAQVASRESAPVGVETNTASQRGQKRGRDEDEEETPQTMKHRRTIKTMPQVRPGADVASAGLAAADIKASPASQDGRKRRRDGDEGETPRTVTTGTVSEVRLGTGGIFGGLAPVDMKANQASQNGLKRRRDEGEDEVSHTTGKYRRPGVNALSRRKVGGDHVA